MEQALTETNGKQLAVQAGTAGRSFVADDILIPKVLLCQPTSVIGDVPQGHFARSTDSVDLGKSVSLIPLSCFKTWVNFDVSGGKPQYKFTEPCTPANAHALWKYEVDGVPMRRDMVLNFHCLVPEDIEREAAAAASEDPDPDDALLPVVVSFSRTSIKVGKEIATHFAKIEKFRANNPKVSLYPSVFTFEAELNTNDQGKWYTWKVGAKEQSKVEHRKTCEEWHGIISQQNVRVDASDDEEPKVTSEKSAAPQSLDDIPF